jgi:3-oxoadipate enol-lactonase
MPFIDTPAIRLHYQVEGRDGAPWLILSNSLGTTLDMWAPQMPALLQHFRVLRYDTRGHGQSGIAAGPYSIDQLGNDVIALMNALDVQRAHFCGLSMGGMTGIWLGIHQPSRIDRLVLCNTGAKIGTADGWNARIATVNAEGMASVVPAVLDRWFTARFQQDAPAQVDVVRRMLLATDPAGYAANCAAVRDMDQRAAVPSIKAPTLVIAGTHDLSTTPQDGKQVANAIAGACYVEFDAAHLSNWEQADLFTSEVVDFLTAASQGASHG